MKIVQSGDPVGEVVTLSLLKAHVRVLDDDDDTILTQYLASAVDWVQDVCHTVLLTTEFTATGDSFCLSFDGYPNPEIVSISYVDTLGVPGTITDYEIKHNRLVIEDAPEVASATVVFEAGIGAGNVPEKLKIAVLQTAEYFYDHSGEAPPAGVRAMVAHHRSFAF